MLRFEFKSSKVQVYQNFLLLDLSLYFLGMLRFNIFKDRAFLVLQESGDNLF